MNKQKQNIMKMIKSLIKEDAKSLTKANVSLSECLAEKMQDKFGDEDEMELSFDTGSGDVEAEAQPEMNADETNDEFEEGPYCSGCGLDVDDCCCDEEKPFCSSCGELKAECECEGHDHAEALDNDVEGDVESSTDELDDVEGSDDTNTHSAELEELLRNLKGE